MGCCITLWIICSRPYCITQYATFISRSEMLWASPLARVWAPSGPTGLWFRYSFYNLLQRKMALMSCMLLALS